MVLFARLCVDLYAFVRVVIPVDAVDVLRLLFGCLLCRFAFSYVVIVSGFA